MIAAAELEPDRSGGAEPLRQAQPLRQAHESVARSRRFSRVLRVVGGAFLIASASTFLLHRWEEQSDLLRYSLLLLHTLLLAAAALFCGFGVKESRGARSFLAIALSVVPMNAAVLGGLVYSRFAQDAHLITPAGEFVWVAPSGTAALLCVALTLAVLTPVVWFAFRTLARPMTTPLCIAFGIGNGLLVLPWRVPEVTTLVVVAATGTFTLANARYFGQPAAMRTLEGRIARGVVLAPLGLMWARAVHLYPSFLLEFGALALTTGLVFAQPLFADSTTHKRPTLIVAALALAAGWGAWWLEWCLEGWLPEAWALPSLLLPIALSLVLLFQRSSRARAVSRGLASGLTLLAVVPNLWLCPGVSTLLGCAAVGALVLGYGAWERSKLLVVGGSIAVLSAVAYQLAGSLRFGLFTHWISLSSLGMLLIVAASYWERYHAVLLRKLRSWQARTRAWNY